jgi:hypothetical protein
MNHYLEAVFVSCVYKKFYNAQYTKSRDHTNPTSHLLLVNIIKIKKAYKEPTIEAHQQLICM